MSVWAMPNKHAAQFIKHETLIVLIVIKNLFKSLGLFADSR